MPRVRHYWIHIELVGQLDHTDHDLIENLTGYLVELIERPSAGGLPTIAVLMQMQATTSRAALVDALRLIEYSTSAGITRAEVVSRPRWRRTRADAVTSIRMPDAALAH